jgi:nitrite reductase/ring-hydroxylating ferredoxin subunit
MDATPPTYETAANGDGEIGILEIDTARSTPEDAGPHRPKRATRSAGNAAGAKTKSRAASRASGAKAKTARSRRPRTRRAGLHRLVARSELGRTGVVAVDTPVGRLAVGIANGRPFAVSDTCRHLFASLGEGRVLRDGCLQCPWHRSRYDVTTGKMVRGPQGLLFLTVREIVRTYTNLLFPLAVHPVVEEDGVLYLDTGA